MLKRILMVLAVLVVAIPLRAQDSATSPTTDVVVPIITLSSIAEQENPLPILVPPTQTLRDTLAAFRRAGDDPEVKAVIVRFEGPDWGLAQATEVEAAMMALRGKNKPVYVFSDTLNIKDYMVATSAKEIVMPPVGVLDLHGISFALYYMNDLLGKLGISAEAVAEGRFKDAMDPLVRNEMSEGTRIQMTALANDIFGELKQSLIVNRGATPEEAEKILTMGPYSAKKALEAGAIDRLAYYDELETVVDESLGGNALFDEGYADAAQKAPEPPNIMALLMGSFGKASKAKDTKPKIALVYAVGPIVDGRQDNSNPFAQQDMIAGDDFLDTLNDVIDDDSVKAVVLRVDSPGGSAIASDRIWNRLKSLRAMDVPIVVSMGNVAASGGYYISMGADKIYAEPMTITGSIGVIGGRIALGGTYDKIGFHRQSINIGPHADIYNEAKAWSPEERELLKNLLDEMYDTFLEKAADGRGKTKAEMKEVAEGRVWSGVSAKKEGLVDELGGLDDAIAAARELASAPGAEVAVFPKPLTLMETIEKILSGEVAASTPSIQSSLPAAWQPFAYAVPEPLLAQTWLFYEATRNRPAVLAMAPYWVGIE